MGQQITSGRIVIKVKGHLPIEELETAVFAEIGKLFIDYPDTVLKLTNDSNVVMNDFKPKDTYAIHLDVKEAHTASMTRLAQSINEIEDVLGVICVHGSMFCPVFDTYGFVDEPFDILDVARKDIRERFLSALADTDTITHF